MSRTPATALALVGTMFAAPALAEESGHKLAVLVVVDQLGSEYMSRWGSLLDGGLGTLMKRGAYYPNGVHDQANTATGPGHASIITGTDVVSVAVFGGAGTSYRRTGRVPLPASRRVAQSESGATRSALVASDDQARKTKYSARNIVAKRMP